MKKYKILYVVNNFDCTSGVSTYILNLIKHLDKKYELYLITSPGTAITKLKNYGVKIFLYEPINFDFRSYLNFAKSIVFSLKIIIKYKIDLVHSNDHYTANIIRWAKVITKRPNVRTIHSWFVEKSKLNKLEGDYLICVNKNIFNNIIVNNKLEKKSTVIFNGIDFEGYKIKKHKNGKKITLIVVARLVEEKGIQNVITAVTMLPEMYKRNVELRIAGKGEYANKLINLSENSDVNIKFLGEVNDLEQQYFESDIFIFSSLIDWFGYTNIEAVKYGCFVITSDFNGIEHIFENNKDGFMYDKNSYLDLRDKLILAIDLGEKRNVYVSNFQKKCIAKFNSLEMASKTSNVYEKCIKKCI